MLQCIALCFVTSIVLGLLPAIRFSRPTIITALKNDSAGSGQRVGRLQRFTAAAQAGLAVPFLVICGVQFDQARMTAFADVGFKPKGLYAARLDLAGVAKTDDEQRLFLQTVQENLSQAPGVASVSAGDGVPLDFMYRNARVARDGDGTFIPAHTTRIGRGIWTRSAHVSRGPRDRRKRSGRRRACRPALRAARPPALRRQRPARRTRRLCPVRSAQHTYTVVGITADLVSTQMGNPRPQLFLSLAQDPVSSVLVIARGAPSDASMRGAFANAIAGGLRTLPQQIEPDRCSGS